MLAIFIPACNHAIHMSLSVARNTLQLQLQPTVALMRHGLMWVERHNELGQ